MPRLFVATYLNSDGVQRLQQLAHANDRLGEKWNMRARWVTADKLHLTWLFLGEVEEASVDEVADALGTAVGNVERGGSSRDTSSHPSSGSSSDSSSGSSEYRLDDASASLSYDHFELWPSPRKARLGVIVPSTVPADIVELAKSISKNLSKFLTAEQQEAAKRPFKPHLTVMRLSPQSRGSGAHSGHDKSGQDKSGQGKPRSSIEDVTVPSAVFPIHQSIDRVELIESDMGKKVPGYVTRASF